MGRKEIYIREKKYRKRGEFFWPAGGPTVFGGIGGGRGKKRNDSISREKKENRN